MSTSEAINPPWSQEKYIKAYTFATQAHQGQTVPGSILPYMLHVGLVSMEIMAALTVEQGHNGDLAIQCALLHDVIEDTKVNYATLEQVFGLAVAQGVLALSKNPALEKSLQMPDSLARIQQQTPEIGMVKLADRITNLQPPPAHWSREKAALYREQAIAIHQALHNSNSYLSMRLQHKIEEYQIYT